VSRLAEGLVEAIKVGLVAWGVIALDPTLAEWFPDTPSLVRYLVAVLVGALLLELLIAVVLGVPRVHVQWFSPHDPQPLEKLDIESTRRMMTSGPLHLKVVIPPAGWIGRGLRRWLLGSRVQLRIKLPNAPLDPFVDDSSEDADAFPMVKPNDQTCGFDIGLSTSLPRAGDWVWADVRWKLTKIPAGGVFDVQYEWHHPNTAKKWLIAVVVRKPRLLTTLRVIRR
jgi:hypothetical protein